MFSCNFAVISVLCVSIKLAVAASPALKIVCYYQSWASRRQLCSVSIEDIDPTLCTDLIYAFIGLDKNANVLMLHPNSEIILGGFKKFNDLKSFNPALKTHVAISGFNLQPGVFSAVARSAATRSTFVANVVSFVQKHGFDGLNLAWEYPAHGAGSSPNDKQNFVLLIREMRTAFDKLGLQISAAVLAPKTASSISYDVPALSKYLDFINLMTYDLHGAWESFTGGNAPLYRGSWETTPASQELNVHSCVQDWLARGANPQKLMLGMGFYGRSFTLKYPSQNKPNSPSTGNGAAGVCLQQPGLLGYNEICLDLKRGGWTTVMEPQQGFPYSYSGNLWVGYDNPESLNCKLEYIKTHKLGGAMIWAIDLDDVDGVCGPPWPLLKTVATGIRQAG